ncbi:hypothetical protein GALL_181190 [mine drainage metagenome]|uniref:Relaxosome protein TraY n=1 Tax=mine drainage metagenome TaxID=410659 RepID=A0A1J5S752_9ZZZZ
MLAIRLPPEVENRLEALALATGRTKTFYAREAILEHLDVEARAITQAIGLFVGRCALERRVSQ